MARKLYIFDPTGKLKTNAQSPAVWVGGFSTSYSYLGDREARLLGVGNPLTVKSLPPWVYSPVSGGKYFKGGASRFDKDFRGWG